jgi:tripartite-type tricarboxylate transporter receptor subunit TctC
MSRILLAAVAAAMFGASASAQTYPTRPITLVVPFAPGGSASTVARSVADKMSATLGQQIIVENHGGAGGTVGARVVVKAAPDGYTLGVGTSATVGTAPAMFAHLGYDARKDFAPIGLIAATPNVLVAHPSIGIRTIADLKRVGKKSKEPLQFGSPGVGTLNHLTGELLAQKLGIKLTHVPYRGAGLALNDLLGGHIPLLLSAIPNAHGHIAAGTIYAVAVTGTKRATLLPQVPTFAEAGLDGFDVPLRWGLVAPAGTPRAIIVKLNQALNAALADKEVLKRLAREGAQPEPITPEAYAALIDHEITVWTAVVTAAGLKRK